MLDDQHLAAAVERAVAETIAALEATGSPVLSDGEQSKPSFATYPVAGLESLAPDGVVIPFADGHTRQLPRLTAGPFRFTTYSGEFVDQARRHTQKPLKQAVIAASALSLLYPQDGIEGYPRDAFIADLTAECVKDIRSAFEAGADSVQIDFTEGRLSCKLDPSRGLLSDFVALNNAVLDHFGEDERRRIGLHTCPGGDQDSTHSADVDYAELLPDLFAIKAGRFYLQMASESDRPRVLDIIARERRPDQMLFNGVIDPIDATIESAEVVRELTLEAVEHLGPEMFGTNDDCGFSPFGDDLSTARETAFAKIKARVEGTRLAARHLGLD
ncbi:MAG: 5-methyltetrahydropteroyltriglutamate--homocysteine methyltransferase [Alphaproteobacteria bacterium]|nr:5-methyltetrahydropteroyltriglutamate--homocysteine methyltransferase [Alphaproteobacteria bacterium]